MSSVLKALKKLENESAGNPRPQSLASKIDTKKIIGTRPARARIVLRPVVFLLAGLLLLGGVLFVAQHHLLFEQKTVSGPAGIGSDGKRVAVFPQPEKTVGSAPEPGQRSGSLQPAAGPASTDTAALVPELEATASQAAVQADTQGVTRQSAPSSDQAGTAGSDKTVRTYAPAQENEAGAGEEREAGLRARRLEPAVMTLQAITWSHNPEACFALIDTRIVRRGDSVNGYFIEAIFEDHVVVRRDGESWRVDFRHR